MAPDILAGGLSISGNTASGNATQNNYNIIRDNTINVSECENDKQLRSRILRWLSVPDVSFNHHEARSRHVHGTGDWLLKSEPYRAWAKGKLPRLWLQGGPGIGKTILCSSMIEAVRNRVKNRVVRDQAKETKAGVVIYHYFSFSSQEKQTYQGLLLSLISQMVDHSSSLDLLRDACDRNQRHPSMLKTVLLDMLADHGSVFVLLDALDECPTERDDRDDILAGVADLLEHGSGLHLMITSRPEPDIVSSLRDMSFHQVDLLQFRGSHSRDIDAFIRKTINDLPRLRALPSVVRKEIREVLNARADGMFRWVACQLDVLRRRKVLTHESVQKIFDDLPAGLDETYDRILLDMKKDEDMIFEARTILQWIIFYRRHHRHHRLLDMKTLLVDVCLFNKQRDSTLWLDERPTMDIIFDHLAPLVRVEKWGDEIEVELAHFTVEEYLLSARIKTGVASFFALCETSCHRDMATTCISYSLSRQEPEELRELDYYARTCWTYHQREAELFLSADSIDNSAAKLLLNLAEVELEEERMLKADRSGAGFRDQNVYDSEEVYAETGPTVRGFCLAAYHGLLTTTFRMLKDCADVNMKHPRLGTALQAACCGDSPAHLDVIKALKQAGGDINIGGGQYETPLHAAIATKNVITIRELLRLGADPHIAHSIDGPPLHHTCCYDRKLDENVVIELLRAGADINALDVAGRTALHLLRGNRFHQLSGNLEILLRHGPDVNSSDELDNTALHFVCGANLVTAANVLIKAGANVRAVNSEGETPLHLACENSRRHRNGVVQALLEAGADPNARRSDGAMPMHLLSDGFSWTHGTICILHSAGAEINAMWPRHGTPLQISIAQGYAYKVCLLLESGVAVDKETICAFEHRSSERETTERPNFTEGEQALIRSSLCRALLRSDADSSSFGDICGPPSLENLMRWFFGIAIDAAGLMDLITCKADNDIIRLVLQAGMEVNSEHLRCYIETKTQRDHDIIMAMIKAGAVQTVSPVLFVPMCLEYWPSIGESLLEAGASVDQVLIDKARKELDDVNSELFVSLEPNGDKVLEIFERDQEAQRKGLKYVPIYESVATEGKRRYGWWRRDMTDTRRDIDPSSDSESDISDSSQDFESCSEGMAD